MRQGLVSDMTYGCRSEWGGTRGEGKSGAGGSNVLGCWGRGRGWCIATAYLTAQGGCAGLVVVRDRG